MITINELKKAKDGDKVRCIDNSPYYGGSPTYIDLELNKIYTLAKTQYDLGVRLKEDPCNVGWSKDRFVLVKEMRIEHSLILEQ